MSQTGVRSASVNTHAHASLGTADTSADSGSRCRLQDTVGQEAAPSPLATLSSSGSCAAAACTGMARRRRLPADPAAEAPTSRRKHLLSAGAYAISLADSEVLGIGPKGVTGKCCRGTVVEMQLLLFGAVRTSPHPSPIPGSGAGLCSKCTWVNGVGLQCPLAA